MMLDHQRRIRVSLGVFNFFHHVLFYLLFVNVSVSLRLTRFSARDMHAQLSPSFQTHTYTTPRDEPLVEAMATFSAHQSGVNALEVLQWNNELLVVSGGDDQSICSTVISSSGEVIGQHIVELPHGACVTGTGSMHLVLFSFLHSFCSFIMLSSSSSSSSFSLSSSLSLSSPCYVLLQCTV